MECLDSGEIEKVKFGDMGGMGGIRTGLEKNVETRWGKIVFRKMKEQMRKIL